MSVDDLSWSGSNRRPSPPISS